MTRLSILALVLLTGCCCNDACQPGPETCRPSAKVEFMEIDGKWWAEFPDGHREPVKREYAEECKRQAERGDAQ